MNKEDARINIFNMSSKVRMPFLRFLSIRIKHVSGRQRSRQGS